MMIQRTSFPLFLAAVLVSFSSVAQTVVSVDPDRSTITWHGSKVTGSHTGILLVENGTISVKDDVPVAARVLMDMRSITCTDITSESSNERLVAHLNSEDFFHTEEHPTAAFSANSFEPIPASETNNLNYRVTGDLTIKGITHPVSFDCAFHPEKDGYRARGMLTFDRTDYDIKYRSGSFFEELGDKMIDDEVRLEIDLRTE